MVVHVGSHLGSGFETGLERALPALEQVLDGPTGRLQKGLVLNDGVATSAALVRVPQCCSIRSGVS